ncbi:bifunctional folylpolyglutamate synthase/dihydrofolate synthase [Streptomyces aureoverticillatus]|uniref:bifunctional folylpolyglutamate synthase/dihydrofolate synthase n=1 Tax=Streptomyces aureoverticillatus TaxID=66871 RepID=UPI0013DA8790|nr:Mur ligase family protein [Streptomyces aureoverticillatus]QIB47628.1 bifunctional folylpolyglutamate synthase/dihydrofolate synthase [Streptomyces aureoverticillatus]
MEYQRARDLTARRRAVKLPVKNYLPPLLAALDRPDRGLRGILVAGTNGKGSTCAFAVSGLAALGLRVGSMPGPALQEATERIRVNNVPASRIAYAAAYTEVDAAAQRLSDPLDAPALRAAAAAVHYRRVGVDLAVMEASAGGRDTAVNSFDLGVKVITNVALDHTEFLGETYAEIAWAKAGVVRDGDHVILGDLPPEAAASVRRVLAERSGLTVWRLGEEIQVAAGASAGAEEAEGAESSEGEEGATARTRLVEVRTPLGVHHDLPCPLRGTHQQRNLALAVAGIDALRERGLVPDFDEHRLRTGLAATTWPGRLELVRPARFDDWSGSVLMDGAHNPHSVAAVLPDIVDIVRKTGAGPTPVLVFAVEGTKAADEMLAELPADWPLVLTRTASQKAADPDDLARLVADRPHVHHAVDVPAALRQAAHLTGPDGQIVVIGSLTLVGETRTLLGLPPG